MNDDTRTKFTLKINGGRERTMVAASGAYIDAAAAVPAMFGVSRADWPVHVEIWSPDVGASAPHHHMAIEEDDLGPRRRWSRAMTSQEYQELYDMRREHVRIVDALSQEIRLLRFVVALLLASSVGLLWLAP